MKKTASVVIIVLLAVSLVASWSFFLLSDSEEKHMEYIDTPEKAITLGIAYLKIEYPDMQFENDAYKFFAYREDGQNWVVCTYDKANGTSRDLPSVIFRNNGEMVSVGLQPD